MSDAVRETLDHIYAALKAGGSAALCGVVQDDIKIQSPAPDGLLPPAGDWLGSERFEATIETGSDHLVIDTVEPLAIHASDHTLSTALKGEWKVQVMARKVHTKTHNKSTSFGGQIVRDQVQGDTAAPGMGLDMLAA